MFESTGALSFDRGTDDFPYIATAEHFRAPVFDKVQPGRRVVGRFWRGAMALARRARTYRKCNRGTGHWYALRSGGYVCDTYRFDVRRDEPPDLDTRPPAVEGRLPFRYARVIEKGALRLSRLPEPDELDTLEGRDWSRRDRPEIVVEEMYGDFFLSLDRRVEAHEQHWYRTAHGEYVRAEVLDLRELSPMIGEHIEGRDDLPLAFTYQEEPQPVYCHTARGLERCGTAEKHARFEAQGRIRIDGERFVKTPRDRLVAREAVRLVHPIERPDEIPDDAKWVHFDLDEQAFVAYEGDRPVYASLISSGKPGRDTPEGLYRIQRKYLTRTMRGKDDVSGIYHVEDVPWTMYYRGPYAVHGAYWHDVFGNTRSHGCTNLAPGDARWLYNWTSPEVPDGWHSEIQIEDGTWFYFTDDA